MFSIFSFVSTLHTQVKCERVHKQLQWLSHENGNENEERDQI
jgi:hypothetical protein